MAITDAGDIASILAGSRDVIAGVDGIVSAYVLTPTIGPDAIKLPAAMQHIAVDGVEPSQISYSASQEVVDHMWFLDILVQRSVDLRGDTEAAMPFIPKVLKAYRENLAVGCAPIVHRCGPVSYHMTTVVLGVETYFAIRFVMAAHAKSGVSMAQGV